MVKIEKRRGKYAVRWYIQGTDIVHCENGPAVVFKDGLVWWCQNSKFHRLDGPAIIYANGSERWWINDEEITIEVLEWISENNLPGWKEWGIEEKTLFALRFR